jgi:hypothetical protein
VCVCVCVCLCVSVCVSVCACACRACVYAFVFVHHPSLAQRAIALARNALAKELAEIKASDAG